MKKKILIIGSNSEYAKNLIKDLNNQGYLLFCIDKRLPKFKEKNSQYLKLDLKNINNSLKKIKILQKKERYFDGIVNYIRFRTLRKKNIESENLKSWDDSLRVNLTSIFFILREIIKNNISQNKSCNIVNISSISSKFVSNEPPSYQISKSALNQMTKIFAASYGKKGIFINSILPGCIIKESNKKKFFLKKNTNYRKLIDKTHNTNAYGTIEDINSMVKYLLFKKNNFLNGQEINIDGGVSLNDQFINALNNFNG